MRVLVSTTNGTVYALGSNDNGYMWVSVFSGAKIREVSCQCNASFIVTEQGRMYVMGDNETGPLGMGMY